MRILDRADRDWPGKTIAGSRTEFIAELGEIAEKGYATSFGEVVEGAAALAAPVLDANRHPITAINITGPALRFSATKMEGAIAILLDSVAEIEGQLGHGRATPF
jgi:DNA-binding IclR family transcriptional regulator